MADATMYDPKNVSGITTLYVTNAQNDPIYKIPYPDEKGVLAFDGITAGASYSAGTATLTGGNGAGRLTVNGVSVGQTSTELSPHQDTCAAGTLSTSSW